MKIIQLWLERVTREFSFTSGCMSPILEGDLPLKITWICQGKRRKRIGTDFSLGSSSGMGDGWGIASLWILQTCSKKWDGMIPVKVPDDLLKPEELVEIVSYVNSFRDSSMN